MPKTSSPPRAARATGTGPKQKPISRSKVVKAPVAALGPRQIQAPRRIWYKPLSWRNRPPVPAYRPLPKARRLFMRCWRQLWHYRRVFLGIVLIYGILNLLLVRGLSGSSSLTDIKSLLDSSFSGAGGQLLSALTTFSYLLASSGSGNTATSGIYQSIVFVICSLAFIWAFRQILAGHKPRVRDSFYKGMYPLVPFLLLGALLSLQLLPLLLGGGLYSLVTTNGIAVHFWEKALWGGLFAGLGLWSLRMITASIFAIYIVTLPQMTPLTAYRSARQLVYGRRLLIWRKLIFLPLSMLVIAALIELPLIYFITPLAPWVFFALTMLIVPIVHCYLYNLYRELL